MTRKAILPALLILAATAAAQTETSQPRPDGQQTPLMAYGQAMHGATCSPLAIFSHGAGGSDRGYTYIAQGLATAGWFVLVPSHLESGRTVAAQDVAAQGSRQAGLQDLVATPAAYTARLEDITAALDYAAKQCTAKSGFPYKVLLGHSMGAETVMLEAGATNKLGLPAGKDRFNAYVAMSPQGPGSVFPDDAWAHLQKPIFVFTGTLDGVANGSPETRTEPYKRMSATTNGCHWLGVIDGATHKSFGGRGPRPEAINPEIVATVNAFLTGAQAHSCKLPPAVPGLNLQSK